MKIIGKKKDGFIVEMTEDEVANIGGGSCGFSNIQSTHEGELGSRQVNQIKVDTEIPVSEMYSEASAIINEWSAMKKAVETFKGHCTKFQNLANK